MADRPPMFPVLDVSAWSVAEEETVGGEEKYWLEEPSSKTRWLFKPNKVHQTSSGSGQWSQREDISEKIAGEIGVLLGLPCAHIQLASRNGRDGCISRDLKPKDWELQSGQVLLSGILPTYLPGSEIENKERRGHSLANIERALAAYFPPQELRATGGFDAFAAFAGYLVFDAIIANRDRHDENWAVLRPVKGGTPGELAGSFDHARAFGSSLRGDAAMAKVLERGLENWVVKGTAWRFEHSRPPGPCSLVELAGRALGMVSPEVRTYGLSVWTPSMAPQ